MIVLNTIIFCFLADDTKNHEPLRGASAHDAGRDRDFGAIELCFAREQRGVHWHGTAGGNGSGRQSE